MGETEGVSDTRRLFWAIELPDPVRERLVGIQELLAGSAPAAKVRWTRPEQMHLTLKFVGETAVTTDDLTAAVGPHLPAAPLALEVAGVGSFGGRRPRVLWAGVGGDGLAEVVRLAGGLERAMRDFGVAADDRPYAPHVTLGRVREPRGRGRRRRAGPNQLPEALEALAMPPLPFTARELVLFASSYGQAKGPVSYVAEARLAFGAADSAESASSR